MGNINKAVSFEQAGRMIAAVKDVIGNNSEIGDIDVGGRNLLLGSAKKKITPYEGAQISFEENVAVKEWRATDAIRAYGAGGTRATIGTLGGTTHSIAIAGQRYAHSIYIKNNADLPIKVLNNLGVEQVVQAGEAKKIEMRGVGNDVASLQFIFATQVAGDAFDFVYWRPQIEEGNVATAWTPAPEDMAGAKHTHDERYYTEVEVDALLENLNGNASTADKLKTPVKINGVDFDGSGDITVRDPYNPETVYKELSARGWYRIAAITSATASSFILSLNRLYGNADSESYTFAVNVTYGACNISQIGGKTNTNVIPKLRHVAKRSSVESYIEMYYDFDKANHLAASVMNSICMSSDESQRAVAVNFTAGEIPEGYTAVEFPIGTGRNINAGEIKRGSYSTANSLSPADMALVDRASAPRTAFLSADQIVIEHSADGGATWALSSYSDEEKEALFSLNKTDAVKVGPPESSAVAAGMATRITIKPWKDDADPASAERYCSLELAYVWFSSNGHGCSLKIERSTIGAKGVFSTIVEDSPLSAWSGANAYAFPYGAFGGGAGQTAQYYAHRFTFRVNSVNSSYANSKPQIGEIRGYGYNCWTAPNNMAESGHMYSWDSNQNVAFPKNVTAQKFIGDIEGSATTAAALKDSGDGRTITASRSKDAAYSAEYLAAWDGDELRAIPAKGFMTLAPTIVIPNNSDLNDFTEPGCYRVADYASSKTIAHSPDLGTGYTLYVCAPYGRGSVYRTHMAENYYGNQIFRHRNLNGAWSGWTLRKFTDTTYAKASATGDGLMSKEDKAKLDNDVSLKRNGVTATIPTDGWGEDSTAGYPKYYDIAAAGVGAKDRADVIVSPESMGAAASCGLCGASETFEGKIRLRAKSVPLSAITVQYWIEKGKE